MTNHFQRFNKKLNGLHTSATHSKIKYLLKKIMLHFVYSKDVKATKKYYTLHQSSTPVTWI